MLDFITAVRMRKKVTIVMEIKFNDFDLNPKKAARMFFQTC